MPIAAILSASSEVFNEVPVRNPGTLAFVPIVDGDLLPDYPVKLAQEGRSHPVPLIIGTNKHESALFRLMRSPLMPITPRDHVDVHPDCRRTARSASANRGADRLRVLAMAAQSTLIEYGYRRRLPDAVGVAR